MSEEDIEEMFTYVDKDGDGKIRKIKELRKIKRTRTRMQLENKENFHRSLAFIQHLVICLYAFIKLYDNQTNWEWIRI